MGLRRIFQALRFYIVSHVSLKHNAFPQRREELANVPRFHHKILRWPVIEKLGWMDLGEELPSEERDLRKNHGNSRTSPY